MLKVKLKFIFYVSLLCYLVFISGCTVGPNYRRPTVIVPEKYKEARMGWKIAKPQDNCKRGKWWKVFNDPELNYLESQLNVSNQNIANVYAQYKQARALVNQALAAYFPIVSS